MLCRVKAIEQNAIESALARAKETEEKTRELEKRALEAVAAKSREVRGWRGYAIPPILDRNNSSAHACDGAG